MTYWTNYRRSLQDHFNNDVLADFIQWSTIQATMFVGNAPYIASEWKELKRAAKYRNAVKFVRAGGESPYFTELGHAKSTNLIHQAYHLKQWLDRTRQDIRQMRAIAEIGAGYGAMALICHRLGFRGRYFIADLPELERIQRYYLWETIGDLDAVYWSLPDACDLLIASHSIGEMPTEERDKYLSQVATKEYLFASSYEYAGVDNAAWFQQLAGRVGRDWIFYPHPYQENAFYQVGTEI